MSQAESVDRLIAGELQAHFACATIGRQIIVLEQTASTNDAILQVATANSNAGLVLFAEHQTAGRGQRGNRWESEATSTIRWKISRQNCKTAQSHLRWRCIDRSTASSLPLPSFEI